MAFDQKEDLEQVFLNDVCNPHVPSTPMQLSYI